MYAAHSASMKTPHSGEGGGASAPRLASLLCRQGARAATRAVLLGSVKSFPVAAVQALPPPHAGKGREGPEDMGFQNTKATHPSTFPAADPHKFRMLRRGKPEDSDYDEHRPRK